MANEELRQLVLETALRAADRVILQEGTNRATAATLALLGALEDDVQVHSSGDLTGVWGKNHLLDIDGATGAINFVIPAPTTSTIGEHMAVQLTTDAEPTVGRELVIKGDTGIEVGGAAAAAEWSRLLIKGERVVFRARSATVIDVIADGRKFVSVKMTLSADQNNIASGDVKIGFDQTDAQWNVGNIADTAAELMTARRKANWSVQLAVATQERVADTRIIPTLYKDTGAGPALFSEGRGLYSNAGTETSFFVAASFFPVDMNFGDDLLAYVNQNDASGAVDVRALRSYFSAREISLLTG